MTKEYQGFAISNFRTGFDEAVEPWLLPRDAYQSMVNASLYRGVLEKVEGYLLFAKMSYRNQITLGTPDGVTATFAIVLPSAPTTTNFFGYGTLVLGTSAETFSYSDDASATVINLIGSAGGTGTLDLVTLDLSITFNTAPPAGTYSSMFFQWDSDSPGTNAIMGIKQYFFADGTTETLVFDQDRVGKITTIFNAIASAAGTDQGIQEIPHDYYQSAVFTGDGVTTVFTGSLQANISPNTVRFYQFTPAGVAVSTLSDNGSGGITGTNVAAASYINYTTGAYQITFSVAPVNLNVFNAVSGVYGTIFTGSISNFFTTVNYQSKLFFTNNNDPIFYYDGVSIHYLNTNLTDKLLVATGGVPTNLDIIQCLHVTVNRERLLLLAPVLANTIPQLNYIYWSTALNPTDFTDGGLLPAPTSQPIRAFSYINTDLIVRFSLSERVFRYTGEEFSPFRWDTTNNMWACDAPYSAINYDSWFSTVGRPAIVGSDGVNVKRADEIIPDFTNPTRLSQEAPVPYMSQTSIIQGYGERFDDIKEGWLCYNSSTALDTIQPSTNILSFNYLDNTYAVYSFPFSCLGFGTETSGLTWGQTFKSWQEMSLPWASYQLQNNALLGLAGDQFDRVYQLNIGSTQTVAGDADCTPTPVLMDVISKNFNPFIEEGQLARLGYIDLFVSAFSETKLRVQFYLNDQLYLDPNGVPAGYYQENTLTFTTTDAMSPTVNQVKVWKRIYVGTTAKSHTIRFYQNILDFEDTLDQPVYIHAMILHFKPAGRIFN